MYGFLIATGILLAALLAEKLAKNRNMNTDVLWAGVIILIIFGVIGARLYHIVDYWYYYQNNLIRIFQIRNGGLGILGGVFLGVLALVIYLKVKKENILAWLDLAAVTMPIGQAIGRFGNIFNDELIPFAPYEAILNSLLFLFLINRYSALGKKYKTGNFFYFYLVAYGFIRLLLEPLRETTWIFLTYNVSDIISFLMIFIST